LILNCSGFPKYEKANAKPVESEAEQFQADRVSAEQAVRMNRNSVHSCGSAASGMPNFTRKTSLPRR